MEITQLDTNSYKLKTKSASLITGSDVKIVGKGEPFLVSEPGEYEVEGISVFAYGNSQVMFGYLMVIEGLRVVYLLPTAKLMSEHMLEELGRVDILMVPVTDQQGEGSFLSLKEAISIVEKVEPSYILPYESGLMVERFVTAYEHGSREASNLVVNLATMNTEVTEVVVMTVATKK